jgi:hypothetical protein
MRRRTEVRRAHPRHPADHRRFLGLAWTVDGVPLAELDLLCSALEGSSQMAGRSNTPRRYRIEPGRTRARGSGGWITVNRASLRVHKLTGSEVEAAVHG